MALSQQFHFYDIIQEVRGSPTVANLLNELNNIHKSYPLKIVGPHYLLWESKNYLGVQILVLLFTGL